MMRTPSPQSRQADSRQPLPTLPEAIDAEAAAAANPQPRNDEMTFLEHLEDLRWVLGKSFAAFAIACLLIAAFLTQFSELLRWPYSFATSGRELLMPELINTSILGVFSVIFYLFMGGGTALSLPFILYFVARFIAPGLNERELAVLRPACLGAFVLFISGAAFAFFILLPAALRASIIFNEMLGFAPMWTASSYYAMLTWMTLGVGVAFQFPLVLLILVYVGIISHAQLVAFRRYSVVLFLCLCALITPTTDPFTFLLLAIPMSLLYELAIFGAARMERNATS